MGDGRQSGQRLRLLAPWFAICRLAPDAEVTDWATRGPLVSVTRTPFEMSVVCSESEVPAGVACSRGWRALEFAGPLDLGMVGILASITVPLAEAGISLFALSTYDTDYVLVRETDLARARTVLTAHGYRIEDPS